MSIFGYIVIGIIIVAMLLVYMLFVLSFLGSLKGYKEALRTTATIIEDLGDMKLAIGSFAVGVPRFRTFHKYRVSFSIEGKEYIEEAELRNTSLKVGDTTEVRYSISRKGKLSMESEAFLYWTKEMAIGYTLGIILGIVLAILKVNKVI